MNDAYYLKITEPISPNGRLPEWPTPRSGRLTYYNLRHTHIDEHQQVCFRCV